MNDKYIILLSAILVIVCLLGQNKQMASFILLLMIFYCIVKKDNEMFSLRKKDDTKIDADLSEGVYNIENKNKKKLMSTAITPILCDDFVFSHSSNLPAKKEDGWRLKKVTKGVYMFVKPEISECLYAGDDNSIKAFTLLNCPFKNLCGIDTLNYKGELDNQNDYRSYFRIVNSDVSKGYYIISNHNNKYVCINDTGIGFNDKPSENCIFYFNTM